MPDIDTPPRHCCGTCAHRKGIIPNIWCGYPMPYWAVRILGALTTDIPTIVRHDDGSGCTAWTPREELE